MKKNNMITMSLIAFGLLVVGCAQQSDSISPDSLSLRKSNPQNENSVKIQKIDYNKVAPGSAKLIKRSFNNAPPLIPHSVAGLVPITKGNNACLGCHMPEVAKSMHATPIPASHFTNFRPLESITKSGKIVKKGDIVAKTKGMDKTKGNVVYATPTHGKLYTGRYNCTQCHVPQTNAKPLVKNNFTPAYRSKKDMHKSTLIHSFNKGINTIQ